ncbi:MAG TPA: transcriptional regulator, partial [Caldimonas sp.]
MTSPGPPEHYRFGPFELEIDKRRLLKDGATIALRPRAFDLLVALVDRAGHLVTKDELLSRVWPKTVVEEAALHVQVSALRKVLGADAITTVSGRGYQFTLAATKGSEQADRAWRSKHNLPYQLTSFVGREATGNASSGYEGQLTGNFVNSRSWPRAVPRDRPLCSAKMRG